MDIFGAWESDAGGSAFGEDFASELEESGGSSASVFEFKASVFDELVCFEESSEVLFMERDTGDGFSDELDLREGELWW